MSFGDDEDILQDFLVEAGEILERLNQQLVDLEQQPDDKDLLNAIFRGFHTVKGGAGFLALTPMVQCCHVTENLFDILRNGQRAVTPELMDVVLQALDMVNQQFELISHREPLPDVDPELLDALSRLVSCDDLREAEAAVTAENQLIDVQTAPTMSAAPPNNSNNSSAPLIVDSDMTDDEFERLLDVISATSSQSTSESSAAVQAPVDLSVFGAGSGDIGEDEFEALLDALHGKGNAPGPSAPVISSPVTSVPPASGNFSLSSGDTIDDDEFEALLDQLHGQGKGPTATAVATSAESTSSVSAASTLSENSIVDDEFDFLLDQLHGKGKGPSSNAPKNVDVDNGMPESVNLNSLPVAKPADPKTSVPKASIAKVEAKPVVEREAPAAETTVRVDTQRLDDIMNMVGELVLVRNRLVRLGDGSQDEQLVKAVANLDVVTADLQTAVMKTRMQPIKKVFGRFPRVVRDLARTMQKEINLELVGEDTDLDKNLVEALADPLVHLVRNSVDHGIEMPDVREANGKSRTGHVVLSAEQEGDHILLIIADDGAGMDHIKLRRIAVEKGLFDEDAANRLSDTEAYNLIFAPGFSTKKEISDVSGRGVGMDVVKTKISQLNGTVEVQSELGKGSRIIIKVPLTLAIMPTLMFMLAEQTFAFPLVSVNEIFHMDLSKTHVVDGQECIAIRDQAIPLFYMKKWLVQAAGNAPTNFAHVVIVTVGTRRVGFVVDQLIGQEEVVIKPLGKMLQGTPGIAGATITGDGTIALILDIPSLLRRYARNANTWGHN